MDILSKEVLVISEVTSVFIVTIFLIIVATGIIMLVLVYQKKQLQHSREKEQLRASFEKEILESKLEIQEQTMKVISQEIHDNIGQVLSLAKLNMNMMDCRAPLPLLEEKIMNTSALLGKAIQDLRDLSKAFNTDTISEMDLITSIQLELDLIKKVGDYQTSLTIEGEPFNIPNQKKLILFRIVQETLNNIIKHAKAKSISLLLSYHPKKFILRLTDNGDGFNVSQASSLGLGIRNMRNRSRLIGAEFTISSEVGKGTTVEIDLPV
jgi:signal transduction histidine kinase